ncbi:hypothetical protein MHYMCMPSP_01137 [Hyalomma marginatum]|nr:hypothetical protein MHYMCMPSP_01137 [Hyalomma marginatum]
MLGVVHSLKKNLLNLLSHSGKLFAPYEKGDLMFSSRVNERYLQTAVGAENILKLDEKGICNKNACQY